MTLVLAAAAGFAQAPPEFANPASAWRRAGNTVIDMGLASGAGGPIARAWFSTDGQTLFAELPSGAVYRTGDLERWESAASAAAPTAESLSTTLPEAAARTVAAASLRSRVYAAGQYVWRSDDGGSTWSNVTGFEGRSIIGGAIAGVAVSPVNHDEIVVASGTGLWRSVDGGGSWTGLNDGLPNLPARRLLAVPDEDTVIRTATAAGLELIHDVVARGPWRVAPDRLLDRENALRAAAESALQTAISSAVRVQDQFYAGAADGRLFASSDRGRTWRPTTALAGSGSILRLFADTRDPLFAIAITSSRQRARVLRTLNGGVIWDDITGSLPPTNVHGVSADRLTGAVYVASQAGVFVTYTDTVAASPATPWTLVREGAAADVMIDPPGNQIYVLAEGSGVYAALAPHRTRDPRVVSAGDRVLRAAAPGSLLSVIGARVDSARAGELAAPVLHAGPSESQVQLPFELSGAGVVVSMTSPTGRLQIGLPVSATSPSIFVDRDGSPLIMSGETGLMLDAATPARSNALVQILASGLGRVTPSWPTGLAAPLQDPPTVVAPVRAWLDREVVEVTRATLAPGYVGLYLVEVRLPALVNRGTAELFIQAGGAASNRVRIYIEP